MHLIDDAVLDAVTAAARLSPRLRKNHNLHPGDNSACHRFFNAIEPGSYIQPHRHLDPEKDETLVLIRGRLGVVSFDDSGTVTDKALLSAPGQVVGLPHGAYHSALSLQSGTIFLEIKAGPYLPFSAREKAPFAPDEGAPEVAAYLERLEELFR